MLSDQANDERLAIQGNSPILLDDPGTVWIVHSGSLAIFGVEVVSGMPVGARRFLVTVGAQDAAFGMTPDEDNNGLGLIAVATEESVVERLSTRTLCERMSQGDSAALGHLEGWIARISVGLTGLAPGRADVVYVPGTRRYALAPGQIFQVSPDQVRWIQILQGEARWLGLDSQPLGLETGLSPFGPRMWLEALGDVQLVTASTQDLADLEFLLAGLAELPPRYLQALAVMEEREARAEMLRLAEQDEVDRARTAKALGGLAGLLGGGKVHSSREGSPLLRAARVVGDALHIAIQAPHKSEQRAGRDPVEAIATASGVRLRRIRFEGEWWRSDCGPLLGFAGDDLLPVALLPTRGRGYQVIDPAGHSRRYLDARSLGGIASFAYVFYRPFPDGPLSPLKLLAFTVRDRRRDLAVLGLSGIAGALLGMLAPAVTALLIDQAIPNADGGLLLQLAGALLVAGIGGMAFRISQWTAATRFSLLASQAVQTATWDRLLRLNLPFFRRFGVGDLQSRMDGVIEIGQSLSGATLRTLFGGIFSLLNFGLMLAYSPPLAFVGLALTLLAAGVSVAFGIGMVRNGRQLQEIDGRLFGVEVELLGSVAKLRVAEAEGGAFAHWADWFRRRQDVTVKLGMLGNHLQILNIILGAISTPLLFWAAVSWGNLAIAGAAGGGLSTGVFLAFFGVYGMFMAGVVDLSNLSIELMEVANLWERARPILEAPVEASTGRTHPGQLAGALGIDHVTFRYRPDGPAILEDMCLRAEPGECIAIVGPSGSGKSTLVRLLLGFEAAESGAVLFDGQDLARLDIGAVRRQVGCVLQSSRPTGDSIFENIAAGSGITLEDAWEAARSAGLAAEIESMPMGMNTIVGEAGANLSGGQRQRLLIARALARRPRLLIFDEATSALDNATQEQVTASLRALKITRVVVAHRLSTIRDADRIYVVEKGRVIQEGTFAVLASQDGLFARLIARQRI